jgi:hypothetical protein
MAITVEALHLHTVESMRKYDDFAAWFACAAAGSMVGWSPRLARGAGMAAGLVAGGLALISGIHYSQSARQTFEAGGSSRPLKVAAALEPYLSLPHGRFLIGGLGDDQILYMDHLAVPWFQHVDDLCIKYPIPGRGGDSHGQTPGLTCFQLKPQCMYLEGEVGYEAAIRAHWFTLISMWGNHGTTQDLAIKRTTEHTPGYVLLTRAGGSPTWIYAPTHGKAPAPSAQTGSR